MDLFVLAFAIAQLALCRSNCIFLVVSHVSHSEIAQKPALFDEEVTYIKTEAAGL